MTDISVDFLLENLNQLMNSKVDLILSERDQIKFLYEELGFLRTFLKDSEDKRNDHEKVKNLVAQIRDVAYEAEDIIDLFIIDTFMQLKDISTVEKIGHLFDSTPLKLDGVMEKIKFFKNEVMEINDKKMHDMGFRQVGKSSNEGSPRVNVAIVDEETVVGFDNEAMIVLERLAGVKKQLEVISIVGMAGLGKTTLARKVYSDPFIVYHFHIRAWICISQAYKKRVLLLEILSSIFELNEEIYRMSDKKLGEELYKRLKGRRYLIVLDDIWNVGVWDDLRRYFPNDNNGSRVILTTQLTDVALHAKPASPPHYLRPLTEDESWDLLEQKVFQNESCPPELLKIGQLIVKKCRGLPLAIVVVAGLLAKKEKKQDWWNQVAESVSSHIFDDTKQCMDILALSYNHLPHHLKACFLYFGAFPEDYEIPVQKLIWLWVAEGFVQQIDQQRSLEDVAENYLMDLIDRSLVIVATKRSNGGIKACRIHDLLRDLCLRKAEEENFLQQIYGSSSLEPIPKKRRQLCLPIPKKRRRLCIHHHVSDRIDPQSHAPHVRTLLCFALEGSGLRRQHKPIFTHQAFELLRVLDIRSIRTLCFPSGVEYMVHLRYLALNACVQSLPASICNLWNLQTLIVEAPSVVDLPHQIWNMVKLRHLRVNGGFYIPPFREPTNDDHTSILVNLQTISTVIVSCSKEEDVLARIPNLRKLGCFLGESQVGYKQFPKLDFLKDLETLNVGCSFFITGPPRFQPLYKFPPNLKKLTLSEFRLPWEEMSTLGRLQNLEVLKLLDRAFEGPCWETSDGEFSKLKFLKLRDLDIAQWDASSSHFPSLQRLVLDRCRELEAIPSSLVDISTLEIIEVNFCHRSANSARQIQEQQQSMGNDGLKILIYPHIEEDRYEIITQNEVDYQIGCWDKNSAGF